MDSVCAFAAPNHFDNLSDGIFVFAGNKQANAQQHLQSKLNRTSLISDSSRP